VEEVLVDIDRIYNIFIQLFYEIIPYSHEYYLGIINDEDYVVHNTIRESKNTKMQHKI